MDDKKVLLNDANGVPESHADSGDLEPRQNASSMLQEVEALLRLSAAKVEIRFDPDVDLDMAVDFLDACGAVACTPETITYGRDKTNKNKCYKFVADAMPLHFVLNGIEKTPLVGKIHLTEYTRTMTVSFEKMQEIAYSNNSVVLDDMTTTDKINFLYSLCADNQTDDPDPEFGISRQIFKRFMLYKLHEIASAQVPGQQNDLFDNLKHCTAIQERVLRDKYDQYFNKLGKLKLSTPVSMRVLLGDCTYADLFKLTPGQHYTIMHSVDISKLKQSFDFSNIVINGDFVCKNQKNAQIIFPQCINGLFDCSAYGFNIDRIPDGAKVINLSYTIKSFADLNKIEFPKSGRKILIARAVINSAMKDARELEQIQLFADKYPDIEIWDHQDKISLFSALQEQYKIRQQSKKQPEPQVATNDTANAPKPVVDIKTPDWMMRKEITDILSKDSRFENVDDLSRFVTRATNAHKELLIKKLDSEQNQWVLCVHRDNLESVAQYVLQIIQEEQARAAQKQKAKKIKEPSDKADKKTASTGTQKLKKSKYKHYVSASVFKQIKTACGDSSTLFVSVLERICQINYDYTQLPNDVPLLQIDKYGNHQIISNASHKRGKAAAMAIESNDNRRVVLTLNPRDKIVIATAFFLDHVNNANAYKAYNKIALPYAAKGYLMDGSTQATKNLIQSPEYIDIDKWLKEYKKSKEAEQTVVVTEEVTVTTKTVKTTVVMPQTGNIDLTQSGTVSKPKRKRCGTPATLVDVEATSVKVQAFIDRINEDMKNLAQELCRNQDNPQKQLQIAKLLQKLATDKINVM